MNQHFAISELISKSREVLLSESGPDAFWTFRHKIRIQSTVLLNEHTSTQNVQHTHKH
jgi:hypothetical protein